jgi:hypothetical protein
VKHVFRYFLFLGIPLLSAMGCSTTFDPADGGGYRVRIPVNDSQGQYHFQTVTLKSVTNISSLQGSVVNIRVNGELDSEVKEDGTKQYWIKNFGTTPAAHFIKVGDVLIPADDRTLVMASIIYQFENIKDFYDSFKANEGLQFPRNVLLDMNAVGPSEMSGNEAQYVMGLDMFIIQPYNQGFIPMSVNGGILGHEWWHSIFAARETERAKKTILTDLKPDKEIVCANHLQYQGLNEGIADFFGYAYSHDTDYGSASFKASGMGERDVKVPKVLYYDGGNCAMERGIEGQKNIHIIGASIASMLYVISQDWGVEETSKAILNFTNFYMDLYLTDSNKSFIGFGKILPFFFENHQPTDDLCKKLLKTVVIPNPFSGYCK